MRKIIPLNYSETHKKLIEKCKRGNRKAQFELYSLYSKAMYNTCLRMVKNELDAEDILQNSFVDVFSKLHTFRYQSSIGAWIKRIVINNTINHLKKNKIYFESIDQNHSQIRSEEVFIDGNQLDVKIINACLKELPEGYKVVFSLYALEGYDHKEIGQILGISEATSKSQYSRARKKLKALINAKKKRSKHGTR